MPQQRIDTSPKVSDETRYTTCFQCACRCGIKVHLRDGAIRFIEGNRDHPVNHGVLCAKGAAGIMTQNSPARLTKPLKRVGPGVLAFESGWPALLCALAAALSASGGILVERWLFFAEAKHSVTLYYGARTV